MGFFRAKDYISLAGHMYGSATSRDPKRDIYEAFIGGYTWRAAPSGIAMDRLYSAPGVGNWVKECNSTFSQTKKHC